MKRTLLLIVICVILVTLVSCGKQKPEEHQEKLESNAQEVVDAFAKSDITIINEIVFQTKELETDDELKGLWEVPSDDREGALENIFKHVTVRTTETTDSTIEYEIEAPNMINVFNNIKEDISESELLQHIKDYATNAETITTTVSVDYFLVDGKPIINYQDEKFINAVTGGLLEAYKTLYEDMMKEYAEEVK